MKNSLNDFLVLFQKRNFRIFFIGQFTSLCGTWTQRVAEAWLAYQLTHSVFWLGLIGFTALFPGIISNFFAGALIDRTDKRKFILVTQILLLLQAVVLCLLTATHLITIEILLSLSIFLAVISGSDMPARQTFLVELVDKPNLSKAIALNSIMINLGRIIGPALAGILLPFFGEAFAFGFNAVTYLAVIIGLMMISTRNISNGEKREAIFTQIKSGALYVKNHEVIFYFLILFASCNFLGMFYMSLLPVFAVEKFHWKAGGFSLLMVASGIGALSGAFFLGSRINENNLKRFLIYSSFTLGFALVCIAASPSIWLASVSLILGGFSMMIQIAGTNTLLQLETEDFMRGRVMSIYTFTFTSMAPLGNLVSGWIAEHTFKELPFYIGGISLILLSQYYQKKSNLKRLFIPAIISRARNKVVSLYYNGFLD